MKLQKVQSTYKNSFDFFLSWILSIYPDEAKDIFCTRSESTNITVNMQNWCQFFVQEIHSSSQMKLKMIIRIESEATNMIINMQKHVRIFLN